jgi:magnesium transporter
MVERVIQSESGPFRWIDVVDPRREELHGIAERFSLHPTSIQDCLEPEHLPKFEQIGATTFLILRAYDDACSPEGDTIQELTRKVAIFCRDDVLITIHRKDQAYLDEIRARWTGRAGGISSQDRFRILREILRGAILSFEKPIDAADQDLESMETRIFTGTAPAGAVEQGYYVKRKASVYKRLLRMSLDLLPKLNASDESSAPFLQDLRESAERLFFYADELAENANNLLNLHISLSSQRTNEASHRANEVMRLLTLFSVFFLPLNFIAGIYGMNFQHMPELGWELGYPAVLLLMLAVAVGIFLWFRRKGWLREL